MSKQGEEYERLVQDIYRVLNANDGLNDVKVQHNVKLKGIIREHQIDVYWQFSYGIQLMQIREPLASDWEGYIKDIYINYTFRNVENVRPTILVDVEWVKNHGIEEKMLGFTGWTDQTYVVLNKGLSDEKRISFYDLINKLPSEEEGTDKVHLEKYDDVYVEYNQICIKIRGIQFVYDVHFIHSQQHIDAMDMAKVVVNNVISGESLFIDIRNNVRNFGSNR